MKVLSNFFLSIPIDGKKRGKRGAFGKKASYKAAFLIFSLHNSSEDALLFLLLHRLIVSSSFCRPAAKSGVGVFGKDNAEKDRRNDLGSTSADADGGIGADDPGTRTNADARVDNSGMAVDDPGMAADDPGTATNNQGIAVDNPGIAASNLGIGMDADAGADDLSRATSNKAHAISLFALRSALFLLVSSSESVTTSLPSSLPSLSSNTSRSKLILLHLVTLVKQGAPSSRYPIDEI